MRIAPYVSGVGVDLSDVCRKQRVDSLLPPREGSSEWVFKKRALALMPTTQPTVPGSKESVGLSPKPRPIPFGSTPQKPVFPKTSELSPFAEAFVRRLRDDGVSDDRILKYAMSASSMSPEIAEQLASLVKSAGPMTALRGIPGKVRSWWNGAHTAADVADDIPGAARGVRTAANMAERAADTATAIRTTATNPGRSWFGRMQDLVLPPRADVPTAAAPAPRAPVAPPAPTPTPTAPTPRVPTRPPSAIPGRFSVDVGHKGIRPDAMPAPKIPTPEAPVDATALNPSSKWRTAGKWGLRAFNTLGGYGAGSYADQVAQDYSGVDTKYRYLLPATALAGPAAGRLLSGVGLPHMAPGAARMLALPATAMATAGFVGHNALNAKDLAINELEGAMEGKPQDVLSTVSPTAARAVRLTHNMVGKEVLPAVAGKGLEAAGPLLNAVAKQNPDLLPNIIKNNPDLRNQVVAGTIDSYVNELPKPLQDPANAFLKQDGGLIPAITTSEGLEAAGPLLNAVAKQNPDLLPNIIKNNPDLRNQVVAGTLDSYVNELPQPLRDPANTFLKHYRAPDGGLIPAITATWDSLPQPTKNWLMAAGAAGGAGLAGLAMGNRPLATAGLLAAPALAGYGAYATANPYDSMMKKLKDAIGDRNDGQRYLDAFQSTGRAPDGATWGQQYDAASKAYNSQRELLEEARRAAGEDLSQTTFAAQ